MSLRIFCRKSLAKNGDQKSEGYQRVKEARTKVAHTRKQLAIELLKTKKIKQQQWIELQKNEIQKSPNSQYQPQLAMLAILQEWQNEL